MYVQRIDVDDSLTQLISTLDRDHDGPQKLGRFAAALGLSLDRLFNAIEESGRKVDGLDPQTLAAIIRAHRATSPTTAHRSIDRLVSEVLRSIALEQVSWSEKGVVDLDRMLNQVMVVVAETVGCDACSLFLYDPYQETLMLRATVGLNPAAVGRVVIRADAGITGLAAMSRQTQYAHVAREHPAFVDNPLVREDEFTSQLSVPIILRDPDRLLGVINLQTRLPHEFSAEERRFIEVAADDLAVAIQSARLFSQNDAALSQRVRDLHALQTATRAITGTMQLDELAAGIAEQAQFIVGGTESVIFRLGDAGDLKLIYPAKGEVDPDCLEHAEECARDACAYRASRATQPDPSLDELCFGAPLMTRDAVLGALVVRVGRRMVPGDEPLNLLQAFADSAALALENAELYDQTRRAYATTSTLLQEMHHRVRNNLQIVAALLSIQAREGRDKGWEEPLLNAVTRIQSIASIHDLVSSESFTQTTIEAVTRTVVDEASVMVVPPSLTVTFDIVPNDIEVGTRKAMILALLINECVTNAVVHGFRGRTEGTIRIAAERSDGWVILTVNDDGVGLSEPGTDDRRGGLGTRIAYRLAESDLHGTFRLEQREQGGTRALISFPVDR